MTIYFASSSRKKKEDYLRRLPDTSIEFLSIDFNEGRNMDIREIAQTKLTQAREAFPHISHIVVEDTGFFIPELHGFPGPFVKLCLSTIGIDGLLTLMQDKTDRTAIFRTVLGYFDGEQEYFFTYDEIGFLLHKKDGSDLKGWTEILTIYGHRPFYDKGLSQLSTDEYEQYLDIIESEDCIAQFSQFLSHHMS